MKVTWVHYLVCMSFDLLCLVIATTYLVLDNFRAGGMNGLAATLFREGLIYFVALTGTTNIADLHRKCVFDDLVLSSSSSLLFPFHPT